MRIQSTLKSRPAFPSISAPMSHLKPAETPRRWALHNRTKMRPTTGVLQLAELNLRTRVVELLSLGAEGGCLTFDDAFNKAFIEKQSLFHCALSPQAQVSTVAKSFVQHQTQKRAADSRTSDRQARRKTDSQSVEGLNPAPHIHEQMTTSNYV